MFKKFLIALLIALPTSDVLAKSIYDKDAGKLMSKFKGNDFDTALNLEMKIHQSLLDNNSPYPQVNLSSAEIKLIKKYNIPHQKFALATRYLLDGNFAQSKKILNSLCKQKYDEPCNLLKKMKAEGL